MDIDKHNFIVKFKESEKQYSIPINKLSKFPDSYFMKKIHFDSCSMGEADNKLECDLDLCTFEDFNEIYQYIISDDINILNYFTNIHLFDYFGITLNKDNCMIKLVDFKYKIINNFVNNQNKFLIMDSLEEYFIYKEMFRQVEYIIPFQYVITKSDVDDRKKKHSIDILFYGNGQLCDFGEIFIPKYQTEIKKENYFDKLTNFSVVAKKKPVAKKSVSKKPVAIEPDKNQRKILEALSSIKKNIPLGLPFDWLMGMDICKVIDFFNAPLKTSACFSKYREFPEYFWTTCTYNMKKKFSNEISYIINGINAICKPLNNKQKKKYNGHVCYAQKNKQVMNTYLENYNKKSDIEYNLTNIKVSLNNFDIREDIYNGCYKTIMHEEIIFHFNQDGYTKRKFIKVYFGFINVKFYNNFKCESKKK